MKKSGLGRGLDALLGEVSEAYENESSNSDTIVDIPLDEIEPNPYQPRKEFDKDSLKELADSIKKDGLIQPVVVVENGIEGYTLVAGERRLRASRLAKLSTIKAIVLEVTPEQMQQYALIENIQREDLNPIELAKSYEALIKLHNVTHEELASIVHKSRTHITNTLRLLALSPKTQEALIARKITHGHAKVLVGLDEREQTTMVNSIVGQKLSVREVEKMVKSIRNAEKNTPLQTQKTNKTQDVNSIDLEQLKEIITKMDIKNTISGNKITLEFLNQDEVDMLISSLR